MLNTSWVKISALIVHGAIGCAVGAVAAPNALAAGTIPTGGGYSNTSGAFFNVHKNRGGFTTVGIVIQIEGYAFGVHGEAAAAEAITVGKGVLADDKMWIERDSVVHITDTNSNYITVAGPAAVEFTSKTIKLSKGSLRVKSAEGKTVHFENAYAQGSVTGEAAVWASDENIQVLGLAGHVKVWHPRLASAPVEVAPGFFTESDPRFHHLQPTKPERTDNKIFYSFLSRFEKQGTTPYPEEDASQREIASVPAERGSRALQDVIEPKDRISLARMQAHVAGKDFDEASDAKPAALKPTRDRYGRLIKANTDVR